jgi:peptidoglycan/LPS O-acetylase OafA/YrhL
LIYQTGIAARSYVPEFDGLRGLACALVVAFHVSLEGVPGGWIGVDLFFVLSGYLITSILLREYEREGRMSLARFYFRRVLRLTPALLFLLGVYSIAPPFNRQPGHLMPVLYSILYIMNWISSFGLDRPQLLGHTWSLGVEEQFYLIWPILLVFILGSFSKRRSLLIVTILIALVLIWRVFLVRHGATRVRTSYGFDTRVDTILIGCVLAIWLRNAAPGNQVIKWVARSSPILVMSLVMLTFTLDWSSAAMNSFGFTLLGVWGAAIIVAVVTPGPNLLKTILNWRPLIALGGISYGVYLWHFPILHVLDGYLQDPISLFFGTGVASIGIAALSYHVIEKPFLRLKLRYSIDETTAKKTQGQFNPAS